MQKTVKNKGDLLRFISTLVTSFWTCLLGVLFIVQVWRIFSAGPQPFTTERISKRFSEISVCVWVWIALILANAVINAVFPAPVKKLRAMVGEKTISSRLQSRLSPEKAQSIVWHTEKIRFLLDVICVCVCATATFISVILLLTEDYTPIATQGFFFQHNEAERLLLCLPFIVTALISVAVFTYFKKTAYKMEITGLKQEIASPTQEIATIKKGVWGKVMSVCEKIKAFFSKIFTQKTTFYLRITLGVIAVGLIVWGIFNGGMQDVFEKAVVICKQCVGIG